MLRLLENQLDAIGGAEQTKWRAVLRQEIERFDRESGRVAWQDGLPPAIEASLQPYRERLEAAYHPATNYFELLTLDELRQTYGAGPR
jgi:hypothetical protein